MRIFYALNFDTDDKQKMSYYRDLLKDNCDKGSFVDTDNFHLTLEYIGEVEDVEDYIGVLDSIDLLSLTITICKLATFDKKNKKIFWLGINENQKLNAIVQDVRLHLSKKLKTEFGTFTPHITLARNVVGDEFTLDVEEFEIKVKSVALFESKRVDGVLVYEPLKERSLE